MSYSVITHSGRAHIDEILAIAVLRVHFNEAPSTVTRVDSDESASMVSENRVPDDCWMIDCGLQFDPENRLLDHHQDRELSSAALLAFKHFYPELMDTDLGRYFILVSKVDNGGMRSLDDFDQLSESRDYSSFPQQILTKVFETDPLGVTEIVEKGLREKIRFEGEKKRAAEWVAVPGRLVDTDIGGVTTLEYTEQPPESLVDGLKGIDRDIIEEHHAAVVYGFDKKNAEIRTLYRTDIGHDLVDFTQAEAKDALFCHQGGFLMRFRPADSQEWIKLVEQSVIKD